MMWELYVILISLLAILLFTTLNLSLRVFSRSKLEERFEQLGMAAAWEPFMMTRVEYALGAAVLRSVAVLAMVWAAIYLVDIFDPTRSPWRTVGTFAGAWLLLLVFGVALPNAFAKYVGEALIVWSLPLLRLVRIICFPAILLQEWLDALMAVISGAPPKGSHSYIVELEQEILDAVSEGERHGAVDEEEKEMIESVIELADTQVAEIMTPRTDIVALPKDADYAQVREVIRTKGYSRVPIYEETIDAIQGVLYAKDILMREGDGPFQVAALMRPPMFIPETKPVRELLREFQLQKIHLAIVLDEYGGTAGLVTIEDILEELVGEIADEYEQSEPEELLRIDEQTVEMDARMNIHDVNHELELDLPEDQDYDTIGGFVFAQLGRIPKPGEHFMFQKVRFEVLKADPRRVLRLRLHIIPVVEPATEETVAPT